MLSRLPLVICALVLFSSTARAGSSPSETSLARSFPPPPIRARAALVMDADHGTVLAAKEPHLRLPMASTAKIMTALLALQLGHLSDHLTVPRSAFDYESDATVMGLHPGQVVTLRDLMYGLLLPSGADAANTIAIHYAGSESRFVALMNQKAVELGMRDTRYATPHGLPAPNQYSSAYDLALLGRYASRIPTLMKITSTRFYTWDGHVLTNVNHVLFWYPNVDGIKPGFTNDAGICQVLDARRHGRHVVVAILNTPDLVIDARNLLNFGLQDFTWVRSSLPGDGPSLSQSGADADGPFLYFPGSGHDIHSGWLKSYLADGGLAALGFPRTEPLHESRSEVQYFQNGALSMDLTSGRISRLALGLTPLPLPGVSPTPIPSPTHYSPPTSVPVTPVEHAIVLPDPGTATTRPMSTMRWPRTASTWLTSPPSCPRRPPGGCSATRWCTSRWCSRPSRSPPAEVTTGHTRVTPRTRPTFRLGHR